MIPLFLILAASAALIVALEPTAKFWLADALERAAAWSVLELRARAHGQVAGRKAQAEEYRRVRGEMRHRERAAEVKA